MGILYKSYLIIVFIFISLFLVSCDKISNMDNGKRISSTIKTIDSGNLSMVSNYTGTSYKSLTDNIKNIVVNYKTGKNLGLGKEKLNINNNTKIIEKLKRELEVKEKEYDNALKKLDLSYCEKIYKSKSFQDNCKLKMAFSRENKNGCNILKSDNSLYHKCLEIQEGIKKYKQIKKWKSYYIQYYDQ